MLISHALSRIDLQLRRRRSCRPSPRSAARPPPRRRCRPAPRRAGRSRRAGHWRSAGPALGMAPGGQDGRAERLQQTRDLGADAAVADDPHRQAAQLAAAQRLPRPLALQLQQLGQPAGDGQHIITTYSAIGRLKTPRALVTVSPRSRTAGVATRSTPAENEWIHSQPRCATDDVVEDRRRHAAPQEHPGRAERRLGVVVDQALARDRHHLAPGTASIRSTCSVASGAPKIGVARTTTTPCSARLPGAAAPSDAGDPARRRADLVQGRQRLGALPDAVQEGPVPRPARTVSTKRSPAGTAPSSGRAR